MDGGDRSDEGDGGDRSDGGRWNKTPNPLHFSVNALIQLGSTTMRCIITIQAPILKKEYIAAGVHKTSHSPCEKDISCCVE